MITSLLFNETFVNGLLWSFALATPLFGVGYYLIRRRRMEGALRAGPIALIASIGPLVAAAWLLYNSVIQVFDLDSLKALALNFLIFTVLGLCAGLAWRRIGQKRE